MKRSVFYKTVGMVVFLALVLYIMPTAVRAQAAGDIVGIWDMVMDMQGMEVFAEAVFSKKPDGTLAGKWTSSRGEGDLLNVKLNNGRLTFDRIVDFGGQLLELNFEGTLKGDKITGDFITDMGEIPVVGTRRAPKVTIVGEWEVTMQFGARRGQRAQQQQAQPRPATKIVFTKNPDGTYSGKWEGGMGRGQRAGMGTTELSDVKLEGNKLIFVRKMQMQEQDFSITFEGTIEGDTIKGNISMGQRGQMPTTLTRVKPQVPIVGEWDIVMVLEEQELPSKLNFSQKADGTLTGKWSGQMQGEVRETELSTVKFKEGKFSFVASNPERTWEVTCEGAIKGDEMTGYIVTTDIDIPFKGKRVIKEKPAAVAVAPPASPLVGAWELTTESQRGAQISTLVVKEDMTGTYTMRDNEIAVQDLKVEGDQVSFKVVMSFGEREFTREFKGKLEGTTLNGEFVTGSGSQKVTGKKIK
ncbi:hypothetical protein ACFL02_02610 [Planctomycetota bacterium]